MEARSRRVTHQHVSCIVLVARKLENFRIDIEAPSLHALNDLLILLEHQDELSHFFDFDRSVGPPGESHFSERLEVIHDLICEADKATVFRDQVDDLLSWDVKHDKHGLVRLDNINFVLASEIVGEADMVFFTLTH